MKRGLVSLAVLLSCISCAGDTTAYTEDELLRLNLATDTILELMQQGAYRDIYEDHTSQLYRSQISKKQFLKTTACIEHHLGAIQSNDKGPYTFEKIGMKPIVHHTNIQVRRNRGLTTLQLSFILNDLHYQLKSLSWDSSHRTLEQCIQLTTKKTGKPNR